MLKKEEILAEESSSHSSKDHVRTMVIGWDGATFDILTPLLKAGFLPNLRLLMEEGVSGSLDSVLPTNSASAWNSFATGKLPSRHGVYEFRHRPEGSPYPDAVVDSTFVREETLWQSLGRHGMRSAVISMPMTYPPQPLDGIMVTGPLTPEHADTFTYPAHLSEELRKTHSGNYPFDVRWMEYQGNEEVLIDALNKLTKVNLETTLDLAKDLKWDLLITVFVSPDRLQHCFWPDLDPDFPEQNPERTKKILPLLQQHFIYLDHCIGQLLSRLADENTTVIVMSDHGFRGVYEQMVINDWLVEQGLLTYRKTRQNFVKMLHKFVKPVYLRLTKGLNLTGRYRILSQAASINWSKTKAYCPWDQQQGISINLKGRESQGIVAPGPEYDRLLDDLETRLRQAREPKTGRPLFKKVIRGKVYYGVPVEAYTPDLLIIPGDYLRVAAPRQKHMYDSTGWATGDHSIQGVFIAKGKGVKHGEVVEKARLIDLAPSILYSLNLPVPDDMDGHVLKDLFEESYLAAHPPQTEKVERKRPGTGQAPMSKKQRKELEDQLKGLGYL